MLVERLLRQRLELACSDRLPHLATGKLLVGMLQHVAIARQKSATCVAARAALYLHHCQGIVGEAAEECRQGTGGEGTAGFALPVKLRLPAILDVDHRERVVEGPKRDLAPAGVLEELGG